MGSEPEPVENVTARTYFVAAAVLLMAAAFVVAKTGRDALYFQGRGLYDLPAAIIGIAALSVPTAMGVLKLIRGIGPRATRVVAPFAMTAVLALFSQIARPGGGPVMTLFFMLVPLVFGVLFSSCWLLAADLLDRVPQQPLAKAYGVIGSASILGGLGGGLLAKGLAPRIEPQAFFLIAAALLATSTLTVVAAHRTYPPHVISAKGGRAERPNRGEMRSVLSHRLGALLLAVGMTAALSGVLIEFQFYLAAATSGDSGREQAGFFANFYLVLNVAALVVQLYVMPRLQKALGVHGSLLILPVVLLGGATGLAVTTSALTRSIVRVAEGGLKASIHRSNWEQVFLALDAEKRPIAKLVVDGAASRIAEGLAAAMLFAWLRWGVAGDDLVGQSTTWLTGVLFACLAGWIVATRRLGRAVKATREPDGLELRPEVRLPES